MIMNLNRENLQMKKMKKHNKHEFKDLFLERHNYNKL